MNLPRELLLLLIVVSVFVGAAQCFFGYRIFKVILGITGFFAGALLCGSIAYGASKDPAVGLLVGILGGALGAGLMVALYIVGVFAFGALLGGVVGTLLVGAMGGSPDIAVPVIGVLAVIGGIIAVAAQKAMIILATSFTGAYSVVSGIFLLVTGTNPSVFFRGAGASAFGNSLYLVLVGWLVLGIAGVVVQYQVTGRRMMGDAEEKGSRSRGRAGG